MEEWTQNDYTFFVIARSRRRRGNPVKIFEFHMFLDRRASLAMTVVVIIL